MKLILNKEKLKKAKFGHLFVRFIFEGFTVKEAEKIASKIVGLKAG